jgi:hypothetical protein
MHFAFVKEFIWYLASAMVQYPVIIRMLWFLHLDSRTALAADFVAVELA